jgi:hypothetical protein
VRSRQPVHLGDRGRAQHWETGDDLAVHADLMRRQVLRSLDDPETRSLAVAITSGAYDARVDQRTGQSVPVVPFHGRLYRAAPNWSQQLCQMRDERCEIDAIWNFLVLNVRYLQDVRGQDTYATLRATLEVGGGDCDDFTICFGSLLGAIGYPVAASVISVRGGTWDHVYACVKTRKGWVPLDPTETGKRPGWEFPRPAARENFMMTEAP